MLFVSHYSQGNFERVLKFIVYFISIKENHGLEKEGPLINWPYYCFHITTLDFSLGTEEEEHGIRF
jgi:hypothetical protein